MQRILVVLALSASVAYGAPSKEQIKVCRSYAQAALEASSRNDELGCGFTGGRWSDDTRGHFEWCMTASETAVEGESARRASDLESCAASRGRRTLDRSKVRLNPPASAGPTGVVVQQVGPEVSLQPRFLKGSAGLHVDESESIVFDWHIADRRVDGVVWQVASVPYASTDTRLRPPHVLAIGFSRGEDSAQGRSGMIRVDPFGFTSYSGALRAGRLDRLPFEAPPIIRMQRQGEPSPSGLRSPRDEAKPLVFMPATTEPTDGRVKLYLRVVPKLKDGTIGPRASRAFEISLPPPGAEAYRPYRLVSLRVEAGLAANPRLEGCARVIGYEAPPEGEEARLLWALWAYPSKGTYCVDPHFPPQSSSCRLWECVGDFIFDELIGTIGGAYDELKGVVDDIKDLATDLAARYNPYCLQAGVVSEDAEAICEQVMKTGSAVALDAYLATHGIPPTLPSSAELVDMAKGDLVELGRGLLEQAGVPCDALSLNETQATLAAEAAGAAGASARLDTEGGVDLCSELLERAVDEVHGALRDTSSRVAQATGLPSFPEVILIPEPAARPGRPRASFRLEPTGRPLDPDVACEAELRVWGVPEHVTAGNGVEEQPFYPKTVPLEEILEVGASGLASTRGMVIGTVTFDEPRPLRYQADPAWLADQTRVGGFVPEGHEFLLQAHSSLFVSLDSPCVVPTNGFRATDRIDRVRGVVSREALVRRAEGPEWLPAYYSERCRRDTAQVHWFGMTVGVDLDRETYCDGLEHHLGNR